MKNDFIILTLLCLSLIVTFIIGYREGERRSEGLETSDTVVIRDTFTQTILRDTTITKFIPKKVEVIKRDTILRDTVLTYERKEYQDTLVNDGDSLILSNTVLGVDASLDSLHVTWKKTNKVLTNTIYITKEKPKKFIEFVPLQTTAGWNPIDNKLGLVVGCGLSVNF